MRKLASQTALYGVSYFAGRLLNFFLTPVYTRLFAPEEFGVISLLYAYITFFNILYTYGIETGYFFFTSRQRGGKDLIAGTAFSGHLGSSLLFSGLLIAFAPFFASIIGYPLHSDYIVYAGLILLFDTLSSIPFAEIRRSERALRFSSLKLVGIILNIFFNFFFLFFLPHAMISEAWEWLRPVLSYLYIPNAGVAYVLISNVLSSFITLVLLHKEIASMKIKLNLYLWKNMLRYSWPLLILGFAGMINETLDRILLSARLPGSTFQRMEQVGIYSACYKLSIFMTLAVSSFRYAAEPFFFNQSREKDSKILFAEILKYFCFATGLIFLVIVFYLPIFLRIIGKDYRQGLAVVPILLLANLFLGVFYYLSQWYKQTNRTGLGAVIAIIGACITLLINFIFIPSYGYMASAWATLVCYLFMAVASYILGQKYYPVNYDIGRISLYICGAIILYMVSRLISNHDAGEFHAGQMLMGTLFIIIYVVMFVYLERPNIIMKYLPESLK
ncbi:MAG: oligosaccharide flippase family protein [Bacteroidota bacterium]|nr:oligosaccharide flippase family protein [Bacteroidota bacterium]